jgi:hypothetical protein
MRMRTTVAEPLPEELDFARDNPRRRREPHTEREDGGRHGMNPSPLRHGVEHVRNDLRRLTRA